VNALAFNSSGHIFVGTQGGAFLSKDGGNSWMRVNDGLINTYVHALAINSNGYIFAGIGRGGVFRSMRPVD